MARHDGLVLLHPFMATWGPNVRLGVVKLPNFDHVLGESKEFIGKVIRQEMTPMTVSARLLQCLLLFT